MKFKVQLHNEVSAPAYTNVTKIKAMVSNLNQKRATFIFLFRLETKWVENANNKISARDKI